MGTRTTTELQREIRLIIDRLGWSGNRLAREIYIATFDDDDWNEIRKVEERVKKELQRSTTKPNRLLEYLTIIGNHLEFQNLDLVRPVHFHSGELQIELQSEVEDISRELTELLIEELT